MTRTTRDLLPVLALLLAMFLAPAILGAIQQGEQRPARPQIVVERYRSPTPPPTRDRPRPTDVPRPTATLRIMPPLPTPNPWLRQPPAELVEQQIARGRP